MALESNLDIGVSHIPFAKLLGLEIVSVAKDSVIGKLTVREELTTGAGMMHGGAIMSVADTLGALGTLVNLSKGATTTTIESKTNFTARIPIGDTIRGESSALHIGRSTMVWQTRIIRADGKIGAVVTQTQLVMQPNADTS